MNLLWEILEVAPAGFEPAPPKRTELKSVALDHSAIAPLLFVARHIWVSVINKRREEKVAVCVSKKPPAGLEPAALRLKVSCSTDWAKEAICFVSVFVVRMRWVETLLYHWATDPGIWQDSNLRHAAKNAIGLVAAHILKIVVSISIFKLFPVGIPQEEHSQLTS